MLESVSVVVLAFLLDCVLGDPRWMPHPVRAIGWLIERLERLARKNTPDDAEKELFWLGTTVAMTIVLVTLGVGFGVLWIADALGGRRLRFVVELILCWQCIAAKSLRAESIEVFRALIAADFERARQAVSMIVGRDTTLLSASQITCAAVETVAENTSDGVIAPFFFLMLGGAPLGLCYKAINTLDSMIGYKNERYLHFGQFAARMDDAANWIPARLSAFFMIIATFLLGLDGKGAFRIWRRDRRCHASPNSAQTESVCAGALGVRLAGDAYYGGKLHQKPTIGDALRSIQPGDIVSINRMMYTASILALFSFAAVRTIILILI